MDYLVEAQVRGRTIAGGNHMEVDKLPRRPINGASYKINSQNGGTEYTHQLFRFPAKFNPSVVKWALSTFGRRGSLVLDPFTGSGTLQVEALVRGINSLGIDIDPLSCFIAGVKTTPLDPEKLNKEFIRIFETLLPYIKRRRLQSIGPGGDISKDQFINESNDLQLPSIPNLLHWFRRYVVIDLTLLLTVIKEAKLELEFENFFIACFAGIIRSVSNADPDTVSGLEVTKIQIERNKSREINVFESFSKKSRRAISKMGVLWKDVSEIGSRRTKTEVIRGDVLHLKKMLHNHESVGNGVPLVVTSPPYCRSVNYGRRHKLEMYWLGYVNNPSEHIELSHDYIGRIYVRVNDWTEDYKFGIEDLDKTLDTIREKNSHKARTVHNYFHFMREAFTSIRKIMNKRGTFVCVIGNSVCCEVEINTAEYISKLVSNEFELNNKFSYVLQNHSMGYSLWNGDGIKQENVLVFKPI